MENKQRHGVRLGEHAGCGATGLFVCFGFMFLSCPPLIGRSVVPRLPCAMVRINTTSAAGNFGIGTEPKY